jgi:hypothetical protein
VSDEIFDQHLTFFVADVVLVLGHERLHSDLVRLFQPTPNYANMSILKLTKLGGVSCKHLIMHIYIYILICV